MKSVSMLLFQDGDLQFSTLFLIAYCEVIFSNYKKPFCIMSATFLLPFKVSNSLRKSWLILIRVE